MKSLMLGVGTVAVAALLGVGSVAAMTMLSMTGAQQTAPVASVSRCDLAPADASTSELDADQLRNARLIIAIGKAHNIPPRGWVVAIATAMQESTLRNLDYGDRDSLGLMQQRPSTGWGSPDQVRDPEYAIRAFYGGAISPTPNPGLLDVPGWQEMPVWQAAQTVQRSAFPYAYADRESLAADLVERFAGITAGCDPVAAGPWTLPVSSDYQLTSPFGPRVSPTRGTAEVHTGLDFAASTGTPVRAVSRGTVTFVGWDGGYGNLVKLRHADGVESWYAHLSSASAKVGQQVAAGKTIGTVGSTGNSTGPHLHLEIRLDGLPRDPAAWLSKKGASP